ncbi:uncharacterized protein LOC116291748 [Actinia tenebrosa]|uniref:Uncharacterized protein LOC116291748 n=1 Tax=Actinia tenebrosa TaxID=6105 RepID=A0A6P8HIX3_ACTTE|nr:uncharacterized protein LOC116291748 [Actinia tenebrosa]
MAFRMIWMTLVFWSCGDILLSEGSAANQTNSTQNYTLVASSTPQTISPTTTSSQDSLLTTSIVSKSSSPFASSTFNSSLAANSTVSPIEPSSTIVQASSSLSGDTLQISAGQGSSSGGQTRYVILPPQNERRDFTLVANTKLHWVRYLQDKSGPEFSVLKQHVEDHLNDMYKDVSGFIKSEVEEFVEEKVTFEAIIYTKSTEQVSKSDLQAPLNKVMASEDSNQLKIFAFEITPRFNEMPSGGNLAPSLSLPKAEKVETVDGIMDFLRGFGGMLALIFVFATIGFIKYRACNYKKKQNSDQKVSLQEAYDNEITE